MKPLPEGGVPEFSSAKYECAVASNVFYVDGVKRTDVTEFEVWQIILSSFSKVFFLLVCLMLDDL